MRGPGGGHQETSHSPPTTIPRIPIADHLARGSTLDQRVAMATPSPGPWQRNTTRRKISPPHRAPAEQASRSTQVKPAPTATAPPAEPTTLFIVVPYRLQGTHCRDARQKNGDSYPRQLRNGTIGHDKGCRDFYFVEMPDNKGCGTGRRDGDQKTRDNWNDGDLTGTPTKQEYIFPVDTSFFSEKSTITLTVQPGAIAPRRIRERVC